ncbi:transposase DNA-binding-containing protein [Methylorubrum thiocyanatum]|uniref:IS4/Tn5 family transposase DNA-binding protein n=1 Tax=Methylorubrum thiocyanatum TaxID=47958 RepID=UPI00383AE818
MCDGVLPGDAGWQDAEIAWASLPDQRLARRLRRLLDQMSAAPGQPMPAACGDWAATKAAYRFFDNPRITEHGILAGHFAATAVRCAATEGPILILQDTTEFIYGRSYPGKIGFTRTINGGRYKAGQPNVHTLCGVLMHSSLAVSLAGTPLGLTAAKFWTRTKFKGTWTLKRHVNPTRVPIETKESYRWLENLRQSMALLGTPERCVYVADRESDIYELFCLAQDLRTRFLVRVQTNRLAKPPPAGPRQNADHRVYAQLDAAPWSGPHHVTVDGNVRVPRILVRLECELPDLIRRPAGPPPGRIPGVFATPGRCEDGSRCSAAATSRSCSSRRPTTRTSSRSGTRRAAGR